MLRRALAAAADRFLRGQFLEAPGLPPFDFSSPPGEPALAAADSVSWRVFGNPVALVPGGIAAVLLELAEPRVASGVWNHTTFRADPLGRMRRTGLAAMITVYGARSSAERMIAGVRRMHERVRGFTPKGLPYRADDPELLLWVHATALYGFLTAYRVLVAPLAGVECDQFVAEGREAARLYGVENPPASMADIRAIFNTFKPRLEPSAILGEFLAVIRRLPLLPPPLRPFNDLLLRASVALLPPDLRQAAGLSRYGSAPLALFLLRRAARLVESLPLPSSPRAQARQRLCPRPERVAP